MIKVVNYITSITPKHRQKTVQKVAYCRQSNVCHVSSVLLKTLLTVRACTAHFKTTCVRAVLCTCVRSIHKFCSPALQISLLALSEFKRINFHSPLKELWNRILSLFAFGHYFVPHEVYVSLHFLPILLVKLGFYLSVFWFFMFLYLSFLVFSFFVRRFEFNFISKDLIAFV